MTTVSPKQREIAEREFKILEVSRPMLIHAGYHGFSMDRIAATLQYSKGTIYNHFSCKEEVILALAIETMEKRADLFSRAAAFKGKTRERMMAIGIAAELFVRIYPDHFKVEHLIRTSSIWKKTSEKRRMIMRSCENRCVNMVAGIAHDALAQGDLDLPAEISPEDLVFGLWSLTFGAYSIIASSDQLSDLGIHEPFAVVQQNMNRMLDGYRWKPLFEDLHAAEVAKRIAQEIFAEEISIVQQADARQFA